MIEPMTDQQWFERTVDEVDRRRAKHAEISKQYVSQRAMFGPAEEAMQHAKAELEFDIWLLSAWNRYRPSGPRSGEVLPGEIERILKQWGKGTR